MDKWDEEKLRSVVLSKQGNPKTTTDVRVSSYLVGTVYECENVDCLQVFHRGN